MIKYSFLLSLIAFSVAHAQTPKTEELTSIAKDSIQEPPHLFFDTHDTVISWVENGTLKQLSNAHSTNFREEVKLIANRFDLPLIDALDQHYTNTTSLANPYHYTDVNELVAISDIHGQYPLFVALLQQHQVIDSALNWIFGDGHLVVNGDIFDRGTGVTDALWLTYKLQRQATSAGGKVHYLMGNHELMVLDNDLRYVHKKYDVIADILGKSYQEQFGKDAFFGRWIRQQPITIKINDIWFVHAGISPEIVKENLDPAQINRLFRDSIFTQQKVDYRTNPILKLLATTDGPLWYRGYFKDDMLQQADITQILQFWNAKHMVIGHTSQRQITPLFGGQVMVIDSSIKNGKTGEVLIYSKGMLFRGLHNGQRIAL
ncbi:metallophosphoesterase [Sphingobacterium sp. lm-10]|uniref:metallophosphoesterase n=1 Tax=Sphingobacterium sp. lm-10 TaxID=2944904 RepID=UPI0020219AC2|nr:metallophosphoesterase [Sphingobacterium sp. lm-10]MCL7986401.1 metallophosphoesterase [Sphingobacterium sp. lm-10]